MADNGSDSDFDDDVYGNDVTIAKAPKIAMKKFYDIIMLLLLLIIMLILLVMLLCHFI